MWGEQLGTEGLVGVGKIILILLENKNVKALPSFL